MDNRAHPRRKTLKHCSLILKSNGAKIDCVLRDISAGGARLWRPYWVSLPARFQLAIPGEPVREVRLCWQFGQEAGVAFLAASGNAVRRSFGRSRATAA
jgi:hypothetical protein